MSSTMTVRLIRLASLCLLGAALGAGLALVLVATREIVARGAQARPRAGLLPAAGPDAPLHPAPAHGASSPPSASAAMPLRSAHGGAQARTEGEGIEATEAAQGASARVSTAAPLVLSDSDRTGRFCLMALGTHKDYRTPHGARFDLMIVSPEDKPAQVLHKARMAQPGAKVFGYLNTMDIMLSRALEGPRFWDKREDWFLHDGDGERIRVRVKNYNGEMARYGMNVAHPGWQAYLAEKAVRLLKAGYDGVQLDNVETAWSYRTRYIGTYVSAVPVEIDEAGWYEGEIALLRAVRKAATEAGFADREIIFNHIRAGEQDLSIQFLEEVDGANAETWMNGDVAAIGDWGWGSRVELARRAAMLGKRTNLLCGTKSASATEALFAFASYLMTLKSDRNTFWYGLPYRLEGMPWYDFYDADLGKPTGEMAGVPGTPVFRRDFEKGVVLVNPGSRPSTVSLGKVYWNDLYEEVDSVRIEEKEGALLFRPTGDPPGRRVLEAEACAADGSVSASSGGLVRVSEAGFHGAAALMLDKPGAICTIPALVAPGKYRVVIEGRGQGRDADAVYLKLGDDKRRIAFDRVDLRALDVVVPRTLSSVELQAAEAGVIVDRITLIRLGDAL